MRYIDHTNCKTAFEKGEDHEIQSLGKPPARPPRLPKQMASEF